MRSVDRILEAIDTGLQEAESEWYIPRGPAVPACWRCDVALDLHVDNEDLGLCQPCVIELREEHEPPVVIKGIWDEIRYLHRSRRDLTFRRLLYGSGGVVEIIRDGEVLAVGQVEDVPISSGWDATIELLGDEGRVGCPINAVPVYGPEPGDRDGGRIHSVVDEVDPDEMVTAELAEWQRRINAAVGADFFAELRPAFGLDEVGD